MGSLDRAVLTGFICRLCSEMHRVVIHIYGEEGTRLGVSEKISKYLSINISKSDPLPKTICKTCLERLEGQHRLVCVMEQAAGLLKQSRDDEVADRGKENSDNNNKQNDQSPTP